MAALTVALSENAAPASVLPPFIAGTVKAAGLLAAGKEAALAVVPARVAILMEGVLRSMLLAKLKISVGVLAAVAGVGLLGYHGVMAGGGEGQGAGKAEAKEPAKKFPTGTRAPERRTYEVHLKVVEVDAQGKEKIISTPVMRNHGIEQSTIQISSGELTVGGEAVSWGFGLGLKVTPLPEEWLRLDVRFDVDEPIQDNKLRTIQEDAEKLGGLMISGHSFRLVRVMRAGGRQTITMPLEPEKRKIRVEIDEIKEFKLIEVPVPWLKSQAAPAPADGDVSNKSVSRLPKVYQVGDLVKGDQKRAESLINLIEKTIEPQSWTRLGGEGTIEFFFRGDAMAITQTAKDHEQIQELLNGLRPIRRTSARTEKEKRRGVDSFAGAGRVSLMNEGEPICISEPGGFEAISTTALDHLVPAARFCV